MTKEDELEIQRNALERLDRLVTIGGSAYCLFGETQVNQISQARELLVCNDKAVPSVFSKSKETRIIVMDLNNESGRQFKEKFGGIAVIF